MNMAGMAESDMATQDRCAAKAHFARFEHDRLMQWQMLELVIFAKEDAEQSGFTRNRHGQIHFMELRLPANTCPAHTAIRQHRTDKTILAPARNISPSCSRLSV